MKFEPCRCGSIPVEGEGVSGEMFVVVVACRAPERHSLGEQYIALGFGRTPEESSKFASEKWESINPKPVGRN